jgi:hypothetical protein
VLRLLPRPLGRPSCRFPKQVHAPARLAPKTRSGDRRERSGGSRLSGSTGGSSPTPAPAAAPLRSDRASSWRRPLRRPSKSFDLRARNARAGGGAGVRRVLLRTRRGHGLLLGRLDGPPSDHEPQIRPLAAFPALAGVILLADFAKAVHGRFLARCRVLVGVLGAARR